MKPSIFTFFCIFCRNIINTIVTQKQTDLYDPPAYTSFSKYCYITIPFSAYKATTQKDIRQYGCVFRSRHCVILFASATFFIASYLVFFHLLSSLPTWYFLFSVDFYKKTFRLCFLYLSSNSSSIWAQKKEDRLRSST